MDFPESEDEFDTEDFPDADLAEVTARDKEDLFNLRQASLDIGELVFISVLPNLYLNSSLFAVI